MDQLARALIDLSGLSVTNDQARNIQQLYQQLHEYDKKTPYVHPAPIIVYPEGEIWQIEKRPYNNRPNKEVMIFLCIAINTLVHHVICRCFLSGESPALLPSRSRLVEAICILLLQKFPTARKNTS